MIAKLIEELRNLHERPWLIFMTILAIIFSVNTYKWLTEEDPAEETTVEETSMETAAETTTAADPATTEAATPENAAPMPAPKQTEAQSDMAAAPTAAATANTGSAPETRDVSAMAFRFPLDCTYDVDCWTARYMDRGTGRRKQDFQCNAATQDKHKGTDYVIADLASMREGVAVLAAADGTVLRRRDGVEDISARGRDRSTFEGINCGNAVILDHGNGWETQYCHLRRGSIRPSGGEAVKAGDVIGMIGLSGETEYPHLHFMVRKDGLDLDPYDGGVFEQDCNAGDGSLWAEVPRYDPMTLLPVYFTAEQPTNDTVWEGGQSELPADSPALILTGRAFHASEADKWYFTITAPDGSVFFEDRFMINQDKQFYYRFGGKKAPDGGFMPGVWQGEVRVVREEGGAPFIQRTQVRIGG